MSQQNPTPKEASAYAAEFIRSGVKSTAFRAAFPDSKANDKVVWEKASTLHKHAKVQERIGQLTVISKKQSEEEFGKSVYDLKEVLATVMKEGLEKKEDGSLVAAAAVVSAVKEYNLMDGNHADKTIDLKSSDGSMTPKDFNDFYNDEG